MASSLSLEERFNIAVKTIQSLPANGIIQPSNTTKLAFYGFYKQATMGPCKEPRPSFVYVVARAKWDAWNGCKTMTKEQAMSAYIDEIKKIIETMPQTNEVLKFAQSIGLSNKSTEVQSDEKSANHLTEPQVTHTLNGNIDEYNCDNDSFVNCTEATEVFFSDPSLSSSSSPNSLSTTSSNANEFYDDASDFIPSTPDEMTTETNTNQQQSINQTNRKQTGNVLSSFYYDAAQRSSSTKNYNSELEFAILKALAKLQSDADIILERLNRLERSADVSQQRELLGVATLNSPRAWLPLSGFRRRTVAFIILWPIIAYILVRLLSRVKVMIRFRRRSL